jgi:hypothetical protein
MIVPFPKGAILPPDMRLIELPTASADFMTAVAEDAEREGIDWTEAAAVWRAGMKMRQSKQSNAPKSFLMASWMFVFRELFHLSPLGICSETGRDLIR